MNPSDYQNLENASPYNLWQDSQYFQSINFNIHQTRAGSSNWPSVGNFFTAPTIKTDEKKTRVVAREQLIQDPVYFKFSNLLNSRVGLTLESPETINPETDVNWTATNFLKSQEIDDNNLNETRVKNKIEKKLDKAMATPVKMCKAEAMMHKMGWVGGGLGKNRAGITAPVMPNAAYATSTLGLGHITQPPEPTSRSNTKEFFTTNVLLTILDFLKNDSELELAFDTALFKDERKKIHELLANMGDLYNVDSVQQGDLMAEIELCNDFELCTESQGRPPNRRLIVYKEAPATMYLVAPEDIQPEKNKTDTNIITPTNTEPQETTDNEPQSETQNSETTNSETTNSETQNNPLDNKPEEEKEIDEEFDSDIDVSNPFLMSITRSLRANIKADTQKSAASKNTQGSLVNKDTQVTKVGDDAQKNVAVKDAKDTVVSKNEQERTVCKDGQETVVINNTQGEVFSKEKEGAIRKTKQENTVCKGAQKSDDNKQILTETITNENKSNAQTNFNARDTIINYFKEFCMEEKFEQFRFVGPFTSKDMIIVNQFIKDIQMSIDDVKYVDEAFPGRNIFESVNDYILEVQVDRNGHSAIYKKMLDKR